MKEYFSYSVVQKVLGLTLLSLVCCQQPQDHITVQDDLRKVVEYLASDDLQGRNTGSLGEKKTVEYISSRFKEFGLDPKGTDGFYQRFYVGSADNPHETPDIESEVDTISLEATNVIAFKDNPGDQIIIIGAHHDHLGFGGFSSLHRGDSAIHNGADDNASGVAILLALSKVLETNNDLLFITFSGEEKGLWGSNYFVKNPTVDLSKVRAMINLDMVGRLNEEKTLVAHGTDTSPNWDDILNKSNTDSLNLVMKPSGTGPSDHTSFYLQNIPVLHFFTGQHEDYHKPGDDAEKINYEGMSLITDFLSKVVNNIDDAQEMPFTKTKDESAATPRFKVTLGVVPDYLFNGDGMRIDGITEGKPASIAGLEKGDIVIRLGDDKVTDMMSYMKALARFDSGDSTRVMVKRGKENLIYDIVFQ